MTDDEHTHRVDIWFQVCDRDPEPVARVEIEGDDPAEATAELAMALRSIANVLDTRGTFEELIRGL